MIVEMRAQKRIKYEDCNIDIDVLSPQFDLKNSYQIKRKDRIVI